MEPKDFREIVDSTVIMWPPKRVLASFGSTDIRYHLVSPLKKLYRGKEATRLRIGMVTAEKPRILTLESISDRFEGFGEDAAVFSELAEAIYNKELQALEYTFHNKGDKEETIAEKAGKVAKRICSVLEEKNPLHEALIMCPDYGWQFALMKFVLEETMRALPVHLRDYERRGWLGGEFIPRISRKEEIETMFKKAVNNRGVLKILGTKLKEYGLWDEYEDRFLSYFK